MDAEAQREFLYAAISDTQETIRAIDSKIEMLLLFLVIPMTGMPALFSQAKSLWVAHHSCSAHAAILLTSVAFVATWYLAFFCAFRTLSSISNPAEHLKTPCGAKGTFYRGGEYPIGIVDAFLNRGSVISKNTPAEVISALPNDGESLMLELAAEQLKVIYIRDVKIARQRWAYRVAFAWLIVGMLGQCASLIAGG